MEKISVRIVSFFCLLLCLLGALCLRVMSIGAGNTVTDAALIQSSRTVTLAESRAGIYDRGLVPLVNRETERRALIFPNDASPALLRDLLSEDAFLTVMQSSVPVAVETGGKIIDGDGIYNFETPVRYSEGQLAAHIIGYMNGGDGVSGIEHAYDDLLKSRAQKVTATYYTDGTGTVLEGESVTLETAGASGISGVVLTLDSEIQSLTETVLKKSLERGAAVVMDVSTGEILASASVPAFDPADLSASLDDENAPFVNRAFSAYAVGSTWKLVVAAAALESGVSTGRTYTCESYIDVDGCRFNCHWAYGHGEIDMPTALRVSCNPYFIDLAEELGGEKILDMAKNLGFGSPSELAPDLFSSAGSLPAESELSRPAALASFAFGQGSLLATPVQMAALVSAIANGGFAVTPKLVLGTYDSGVFAKEPVYAENPAMSTETAAAIREMMIGVVESGSGEAAKPENGGAGGKTASAQTGQYDENGEEIVHAWFVGFYPADEPKYAVVVFAEGMNSGGDYAAPVFKQICDGIWKLKYD